MKKNRLKLLFLIHDLGQGGAEKVLVNLVNNMDQRKFDITVISLFGGGVNEQFLKETIRYKTIFKKTLPGNSKVMKLFSPRFLHKLFVKDKYDIEVSYLEGPSARIISGCPNKETKLVSWIHTGLDTKEKAASSFRNYKESVVSYSRFHKNICVSGSVKDDFVKTYPMVKEVQVLYNTNETDKIISLKNEIIEEVKFSDKTVRLCGVGRLIPLKRFDWLIGIHKRLKQNGYSVHTFLLGEGPEKKKLEDYVKKNKLEDSFTFLGYQTNPYKYVANSDIFVCSSEVEGFSTAATEALIVGTPVVTTPVAGMEEMLGKNGEYGIISEMSEESLYEKIKELLDDKTKLEHYKIRALERGKDFMKEKTVAAVEEMLAACIENN